MLTEDERWLNDTITRIRINGFWTLEVNDVERLERIADKVRKLNSGKCVSGCKKVIEEMQRMLEDDVK